MGMYSFFDYEDIEIVDMDGLKRFLEENKEYDFVLALSLDEENKTLSFEGMDNWKIISYWYAEFVHMLRQIAAFIDGEVHWNFENNDEGGYVTFEDGEVTIHCGQMSWSEHKADEFITDRQFVDEETQKKLVIPDWIVQRVTARQI